MKRALRSVIVALAVAGALLLLEASSAAAEDLRPLLRELSIQLPAREVSTPAFTLPDTNGAPVRLADYQGRAVLIYFWTTY